ncbi:hypothetical protein SDJN02_14152, partial [Cucurbita argyrosperma subsp. argyrosperma]
MRLEYDLEVKPKFSVNLSTRIPAKSTQAKYSKQNDNSKKYDKDLSDTCLINASLKGLKTRGEDLSPRIPASSFLLLENGDL